MSRSTRRNILDRYPLLANGQAIVVLLAEQEAPLPYALEVGYVPPGVDVQPEATLFTIQDLETNQIRPLLALKMDLPSCGRSIRFSVGPGQLAWADAVLESGFIAFSNHDGTAALVLVEEIRQPIEEFASMLRMSGGA